MKNNRWRLLPLVIFAGLAVFLWRGLSLEPQKLPAAQLGKNLPSFELPTLGDERERFTESLFSGKTVLLNVWASWCSSCTDEQAFLMQLAGQGMPIFGLNYRDNTVQAKRWLDVWGNPYQSVGEDPAGSLALDLGVYGTPETFLIDAQGIIRYRHVGVLDEQSWKKEFLPRIEQLEKKS